MLLALLMLASVLPLSALAATATESATGASLLEPAKDPNVYSIIHKDWGVRWKDTQKYKNIVTGNSGNILAGSAFNAHYLQQYGGGGRYVFCLDKLSNITQLEYDGDSAKATGYWTQIQTYSTKTVKAGDLSNAIVNTMYFGFGSHSASSNYYMATFTIIWELLGGYRNPNTFVRSSDKLVNNLKFTKPTVTKEKFTNAYNYIVNQVTAVRKRPAFYTSAGTDKTITLTSTDPAATTFQASVNIKGESGFTYTLTGKDKGLVRMQQSSAALTFTSSSELKGKDIALTVTHNLPKMSIEDNNIFVYGSNNNAASQTVIGGCTMPVAATETMSFSSSTNPVLRKVVVDADGNPVSDPKYQVSGLSFEVTPFNQNGIAQKPSIYTTDANGEFTFPTVPEYKNIELNGWVFKIKELGIKQANGSYLIPEYYQTPTEKTITVTDTNKSFTFENVISRGRLTVNKISQGVNASGNLDVQGYYFEATDQSTGESLILGPTDENGAVSADDLQLHTYVVSELGKRAADGSYSIPKIYSVPASQTIALQPGNNELEFYNERLQVFVEVKKSDRNTGEMLSGATFRIYKDKACTEPMWFGTTYDFREVSKGVYQTPGNVGAQGIETENVTYYVRETAAPEGYELNPTVYPVTISRDNISKIEGEGIDETGIINAGEKVTVTEEVRGTDGSVIQPAEYDYFIYNTPQQGTLVLNKTRELVKDDGTQETVKAAGISFRFKGTSSIGKQYDEILTTDRNGRIQLPGIYIGDYTISEIYNDAVKAYVLVSNTGVTIKQNATTTLTFNNVLKRGNVEVTKTAEDGKVSGIQFKLFGTSVSGAKVELTAKTDSKGIARFNDVLIGTYRIEEINTESKYIQPAAQNVTVEWNKTAKASFENILKRGNIKVVKTAEDRLVEGMKFRLYGWSISGTYLSRTATTDRDGIAEFKDILIGDYQLEEINTESKYIQPAAQNVTVEWNKTAKASFENILKRGNVEITKTSEDGFVENREFRLFGTTIAGTKIDLTAKTDSKGIARFNDVLIGTYTIEEVGTEEKYIVPATQNVTVKWNETAKASFENILKRGNVKVIKTAEDGIIEEKEFRLYGTSLSGENVDMTAVTDLKGVAQFENVLIGSYTIEEVGTEEKYIVPAAQNVTVEWDKTAEITFENILKRGSVQIQKTSEDGIREGFKFRLYGTSLSGTKVDQTAVTDAQGIAEFREVLIGTYTVEEIEVPDRYIVPQPQEVTVSYSSDHLTPQLDTLELKTASLAPKPLSAAEPQSVSFVQNVSRPTGNLQLTIVQFNNILKKGTLEFLKTDESDNKPLEGCELAVADESGTIVKEAATDKDGKITIAGLPYGTYTYQETKAPEGYVLDKKSYTFSITEDGQIVTAQMKNRKIPVKLSTNTNGDGLTTNFGGDNLSTGDSRPTTVLMIVGVLILLVIAVLLIIPKIQKRRYKKQPKE